MRVLRIAGALLAVQLVLVGVYLGVEGLRGGAAGFSVEPLDEPAPDLVLLRGAAPVALPDAPHLVHFWATWCAPCIEELPRLVAAAEGAGVPLVAVTDEPWPVVEAYFGGTVPDGIARDASGDAVAEWRVSGLPDTFVVRDGTVVGRMGGPRDWDTSAARGFLRDLRRAP